MFAHGFGCDQRAWKFITDAFIPDYRVVLFDYVGSGKSDINQYDYHKYATLEGYACDVLDIIAALDLKKIVFIGHSISSMIGMIAALQRPDIFEKLIFIGPSPRYLNDNDYFGGFDVKDLETLFNFIAIDLVGWSKAMAPLVMDNPERPELTEFLQESFESMDPKIALAFAKATFTCDHRDKLRQVSVPSLTVQSRQDMISPPNIGEYIRKHTPGNILKLLDTKGHYPHISNPDQTVKAIKAFIEDKSLNFKNTFAV